MVNNFKVKYFILIFTYNLKLITMKTLLNLIKDYFKRKRERREWEKSREINIL